MNVHFGIGLWYVYRVQLISCAHTMFNVKQIDNDRGKQKNRKKNNNEIKVWLWEVAYLFSWICLRSVKLCVCLCNHWSFIDWIPTSKAIFHFMKMLEKLTSTFIKANGFESIANCRQPINTNQMLKITNYESLGDTKFVFANAHNSLIKIFHAKRLPIECRRRRRRKMDSNSIVCVQNRLLMY